MSILNSIFLCLNRIIVLKTIDMIRPLITALVIIKDTGQSILINRKYLIKSKSLIQQLNKQHNVFLDA